MKLITKNFKLNVLANSYAAAIHEHVTQQHGEECFYVLAGGHQVKIQIINGKKGVREIIDAYFLEAMQISYRGWEVPAIQIFERCLLDGFQVTAKGLEIWESMLKDIGSTISGNWEDAK